MILVRNNHNSDEAMQPENFRVAIALLTQLVTSEG